MQSAALVHAVDHQSVEHSEWCQALSHADQVAAVPEPPTTNIAVFQEPLVSKTLAQTPVKKAALAYASRAPPSR